MSDSTNAARPRYTLTPPEIEAAAAEMTPAARALWRVLREHPDGLPPLDIINRARVLNIASAARLANERLAAVADARRIQRVGRVWVIAGGAADAAR